MGRGNDKFNNMNLNNNANGVNNLDMDTFLHNTTMVSQEQANIATSAPMLDREALFNAVSGIHSNTAQFNISSSTVPTNIQAPSGNMFMNIQASAEASTRTPSLIPRPVIEAYQSRYDSAVQAPSTIAEAPSTIIEPSSGSIYSYIESS